MSNLSWDIELRFFITCSYNLSLSSMLVLTNWFKLSNLSWFLSLSRYFCNWNLSRVFASSLRKIEANNVLLSFDTWLSVEYVSNYINQLFNLFRSSWWMSSLLILILSSLKSIYIWFVVKLEVLETRLRDSCTNIFRDVQSVTMLLERVISRVDIYMREICSVSRVSLAIVVSLW